MEKVRKKDGSRSGNLSKRERRRKRNTFSHFETFRSFSIAISSFSMIEFCFIFFFHSIFPIKIFVTVKKVYFESNYDHLFHLQQLNIIKESVTIITLECLLHLEPTPSKNSLSSKIANFMKIFVYRDILFKNKNVSDIKFVEDERNTWKLSIISLICTALEYSSASNRRADFADSAGV